MCIAGSGAWPQPSRGRGEEMRTDDLVAMLSTNVERVDRWQFVRTLGAAILIGAATAFAAVLLALGTRNDLPNSTIAMHVALKIAFTAGTLALTWIALTKLARPGGE